MRIYKFETTNEYFDYLDFHDCLVEKIQVENDAIIIDLNLYTFWNNILLILTRLQSQQDNVG